MKKGVPSAESSRTVRGLGKGGPGVSGRVLPPVTGRSRVFVQGINEKRDEMSFI